MIKILYTFELSKEQEVEESVETTNEAGEKVTTVKKVKKPVPYKYHIAKPSRGLQEDAEMYRMVKFSEATRKGVLTHDLLSKRLQNDDGVLSEQEKEKYKSLYTDLFNAQKDIQKLGEKPESERTPEEKVAFEDGVKKLKKIRQEIRDFELSKSNLFEFTAETYARNKLIFWYLMYLSYKTNSKGEPEPFFAGKDYEAKAAAFDEIEEQNDVFVNQVIQKFMYYTTLWFISEVSNPEQFAQLVKDAESEENNK